jgi:acetyl esterase/lipase
LGASALLAASTLPVKNTYTYKMVEGRAIEVDVYSFPDQTVRPAILFFHGGALILGDRGMREDVVQRYIDAGFVLVSPDYRLAPETKLPDILADVQDAYQWMREKGPSLFHIDPDRIGVAGGSAGGYLTLTCGYRLSPRPRVLVSFYGYGDIIGEWYVKPAYMEQRLISKEEAFSAVGEAGISGKPTIPNPHPRSLFYFYCRQHGIWPQEVSGHDPQREPRYFDPYCPARNVTAQYPPTLLIHGDKDEDVPYTQSEQMADELKRHGVECKFLLIPGRGHGFDSQRNDPVVTQVYATVIDFLKKHLE